jgi:hypothetical protein
LIAALLRPSFYPKCPAEVTQKTHISHLYFAGDLVYKIKKAVRFSFLDYFTLGKRRYLHQPRADLRSAFGLISVPCSAADRTGHVRMASGHW